MIRTSESAGGGDQRKFMQRCKDMLCLSSIKTRISGQANATTGELTLTGSATLANYETAFAQHYYITNTADNPIGGRLENRFVYSQRWLMRTRNTQTKLERIQRCRDYRIARRQHALRSRRRSKGTTAGLHRKRRPRGDHIHDCADQRCG